MNRRNFLAAAGALAAWGASASRFAYADEWRDAFHRGLAARPSLAGLAGTDKGALDCAALEVEGRFPVELSGTMYRIGPARYELGGARMHHWFDGDGMAQAFRIDGRNVSHAGRMVETTKYVEETRAGRFLYGGFAQRGEKPLANPDSVNAANTNILPHAGRLYALWEAGSAWELEPTTLASRGPVAWRDDLKGMPFSAHPKVDADGTLWSFGTSFLSGHLVLYRISPAGALVRAQAIPVPGLPMVHDFTLTARHLVFLLPPLAFDAARFKAGATVMESYQWRPQDAMRVLVVDKDDWSKRRWHELPAGFVFHLGNAWEEASGAIRFAYVHAPDASSPMGLMRDAMRGDYAGRGTYSDPQFALVTLPSPAAAPRQELVAGSAEFPRFDERYVGKRARYLFGVAEAGERTFGFRGIQRLDLESGKVDRYLYPEGVQAEEHVFVPKKGASREGEGWLMGTSFDYRRGVTRLAAFDARRLAAGPVAIARLPYGLPLGFHGNFMAA
jgi:carotenoid cleavage dioxygenase